MPRSGPTTDQTVSTSPSKHLTATPTDPEAGSSPAAQVHRRRGPRSNTKAPSSLHKRLTSQLAGIMAHLEKNPNDILSRKRVDTINELLRR